MDGLILRLRVLVRRVAPILLRQGWDEADVRRISPAIKARIDARDEPALRNWCAWLSSKLPAAPTGTPVRPVLPYETERRLADKAWAREHGAK